MARVARQRDDQYPTQGAKVTAAWGSVADVEHKAEIAWTEVDQADRRARCLDDEVRVLTDRAEHIEAGVKVEQLARLG